jgi:hypothetical protein
MRSLQATLSLRALFVVMVEDVQEQLPEHSSRQRAIVIRVMQLEWFESTQAPFRVDSRGSHDDKLRETHALLRYRFRSSRMQIIPGDHYDHRGLFTHDWR